MGKGWTKKDGKPLEYKLLPGVYKIWLQDQSVKQRPVIWVENVEVKAGEAVERVATFGQGGILHVKAIKDNAPIKTYVKVYRQEDGKDMGKGWTKKDGKPLEYKLLPGVYKIWLQDQSVVAQWPLIWIENVEVKAGETVERVATFGQGGILQVKAIKNNAPAETYVKVYRQEDGKQLGKGWTKKDGKPLEYKLLPGTYTAKVEDRTDRSVREIRDIQVQSGKTLTVNAAFPVEEEAPAQKPTPATTPAPQARSEAAPAPQKSGDTIMSGEVPLYPGAKVLNEKTYGPNSKVDMVVPATPEEVINYYKHAMTAKGWQPGMAMVQGNVGVLQLKKNGGQLVIKVQGQGQTSKVSMALMGQ
jgi:hypothetical protein